MNVLLFKDNIDKHSDCKIKHKEGLCAKEKKRKRGGDNIKTYRHIVDKNKKLRYYI